MTKWIKNSTNLTNKQQQQKLKKTHNCHVNFTKDPFVKDTEFVFSVSSIYWTV